MADFFVESRQIQDDEIVMEGSDVNHLVHVLRRKPQDDITVCDRESGARYRCRIIDIAKDLVRCEILYPVAESKELPVRIYLFQGLPKADKMELIIQKAVELGVYAIVPMSTQRAIVKLDEKKAEAKIARWQSIAEAAAKQCGRNLIPQVMGQMSFTKALSFAGGLDVCYIPYELALNMQETRDLFAQELQEGRSIGIFIGPEGGFDTKEIEQAMSAGAHAITLGRRILRTETAGMTVLAYMNYCLEE